MAKAVIIVGVDITWITPEPQYPPVVEDIDSYEDTLDKIVTSGCLAEGFTVTKMNGPSMWNGSDKGYIYEVTE
jgi:hypothetical protein